MNRYRKKYQQSDDDQVSIFDSEEDEPRKHKTKAPEKKQKKEQNEVKKRMRAPSQKAIEKKLSKFQKDIMKDLIDKDEENKATEPTAATHQEESEEKKEPVTSTAEVKEEDTIVLPSSVPVKNNLDEEDFKLEEEDLTWFDLQEVKAKQEYTPHLQSNQPNQLIYNYNQHGYPPYPNQIKQNKQKRAMPAYQSSTYQPIYSPYVAANYGINQAMYNGYYGNAIYGQYDNRSFQHPYYPFQAVSHYSPTLPDNQEYDPELLDSAELEESMLDDKNYKLEEALTPIAQEPFKSKLEAEEPIREMTPEELKAHKKAKKQKILQEIQKLKSEFKSLQDQTEEMDNQHTQQNDKKDQIISKAQKLYRQWKFDPKITELPEASYKKVESTAEAEEKFQKSKTEGRMVMIEQVLSENPFLTQFEMAEVLRARDPGMNAKIERSVVLRLLKMGGYKKKKILLMMN